MSYLNETITLADDSTVNIRKAISSLEEDGTALTARATVDLVDANASSYWHDTANSKLYCHTSDSADPDTHTMIGFFWLYFGTQGKDLNSVYYEPYIAEDGIPELNQSLPNLYWGVAPIGGGRLILLNADGFFDQISKIFIWTGKKIKILLGGDSLAYGEYQILNTFTIENKEWSREEFRLELKSTSFDLMRTVPINKFWISDYANLDPSIEGAPIPIYYGVYSAAQGPIVTCIDTAFAANTYQFKICDHAINSITQVYYDLDDGVGWQAIAHGNEDLDAATFTIVLATFVVGTTKVKVAFEGKHSGGTLYEGAPEIAENILTNILSYAAGDLNAASFTTSKVDSDVRLNVPIENETEALRILEKICLSDLAFLDEDETGDLRYRTWKPYLGGTYVELKDYDFVSSPETFENNDQLYSRFMVGYSYYCSEDKYLYQTETDLVSEYKYDRKEELKVDTYIRNSSDATILAQRLKLLLKDPTTNMKVDLKIPVIDKLLGDKVKLTMTRAPFEQSTGYNQRHFEISGRSISCFPVINSLELFDLKEFGLGIGYWTDATAPTWDNATDADKITDGYWCDANGYAKTGDEDSLNVSRWW